jgi:hypothetical protein
MELAEQTPRPDVACHAKEVPMKSLMIATALVAVMAATGSAANAENTSRNGYYQSYRAGDVTQPRRGAFAYGPNQCWTDEGYGRFSPCNGRGR